MHSVEFFAFPCLLTPTLLYEAEHDLLQNLGLFVGLPQNTQEPREGVEPPTPSLQKKCSDRTELTRLAGCIREL